jgi:hypothetical protein
VAIEPGVANHQAPKQSKALVRDPMTRHIILVVGAFAIMSLTVIALGALLPLSALPLSSSEVSAWAHNPSALSSPPGASSY